MTSEIGKECRLGRTVAWLSDLENHYQALLGLCNALEKIADNLPDNVDAQECLYVARSIYPVVKSAHEYEEKSVFPHLETLDSDAELAGNLDRLHAEHWEDESFAGELQDALIEFVTNPGSSNPETLGYMLRGFFEGLRRHVAFERNFFPQRFQAILS